MRYAVWMTAEDARSREPEATLDFLEQHGINACNLGLHYHGGRMLLPAHPEKVVYEHRQGDAGGCEAFLQAAARRRFDVRAWVVLCHNDNTALPHIVNAFGEVYPYALCPAHDEVRRHCVSVCQAAAGTEGIAGLDIEALSWMGYEHGGLHDKRGVPMNAEAARWLSVCCCDRCSRALPGIAAELRQRIRSWLDDPYAPVEPMDDAPVVAYRRRVQLEMLQSIRAALPGTLLNVRASADPRFSGGKCSLPLDAMAGLADEATFTFFGIPLSQMRLPESPPLPVHCGFVFHEPDCRSAGDVHQRLAASNGAGYGFYSFSMAARPHWRWLQQALKGNQQI